MARQVVCLCILRRSYKFCRILAKNEDFCSLFPPKTVYVLHHPLRRKQPAGGIDVLAARGADGGDDALVVERVAEPGHRGHVGTLQRDVRHGMIPY